MLILLNVLMELSNVREKKKELLNVSKVSLNVMLILPNVTMKSSNVKKKKETTNCDKNIIICDLGAIQYDD